MQPGGLTLRIQQFNLFLWGSIRAPPSLEKGGLWQVQCSILSYSFSVWRGLAELERSFLNTQTMNQMLHESSLLRRNTMWNGWLAGHLFSGDTDTIDIPHDGSKS